MGFGNGVVIVMFGGGFECLRKLVRLEVFWEGIEIVLCGLNFFIGICLLFFIGGWLVILGGGLLFIMVVVFEFMLGVI